MRTIDTTKISPKVATLQAKFASLIVGQDEAITAITSCLEKFTSGMTDPKRPIASLLFLGPTGTGKTSVVEAFVEGLYGNSNSMIKVDCCYGFVLANNQRCKFGLECSDLRTNLRGINCSHGHLSIFEFCRLQCSNHATKSGKP